MHPPRVNFAFFFDEIKPSFAFELLSHMKGGPSIEVLLDLALDEDSNQGNDFRRCKTLKA